MISKAVIKSVAAKRINPDLAADLVWGLQHEGPQRFVYARVDADGVAGVLVTDRSTHRVISEQDGFNHYDARERAIWSGLLDEAIVAAGK